MSTRWSPPDRSNKPTVAETLEEIRIESRAEAKWADTRKTLVGITSLVAVGIGVSFGTNTWAYIGALYVVLAAAWGIRRLIVRRDIRFLREARRRQRRRADGSAR